MSTNKRKSRADPATKRRKNLTDIQQRQLNIKAMAHRKILPGREIDHNVFTSLRTDFQRLPWLSFVTLEGMYYPILIHEFYASFDYKPFGEDTQIFFTLGNTEYNLTKAQFGDLLGIPHSGIRFYSQAHKLGDLPSSTLTPEYFVEQYCLPNIDSGDAIENGVTGTDLRPPFALWHTILNHNVYAKGGNMANVMAAQAVMIHCLESQTDFDMTHFVASRMSGLVTDQKRALPYGVLLTRLFRALNIQLNQPFKNTQTSLGSETLRKMNRSFSGQTSASRHSTSRARIPSPESPDLPPITFGTTEEDFNTMTSDDRLSYLYSQNQQLRIESREIRKENKGLKKMLKTIMGHLGCGSSSPTHDND